MTADHQRVHAIVKKKKKKKKGECPYGTPWGGGVGRGWGGARVPAEGHAAHRRSGTHLTTPTSSPLPRCFATSAAVAASALGRPARTNTGRWHIARRTRVGLRLGGGAGCGWSARDTRTQAPAQGARRSCAKTVLKGLCGGRATGAQQQSAPPLSNTPPRTTRTQ